MLKIFLKILLYSFFSISLVYAENINVFNFTEDEIQSLEVRKVRGADNKTEYSLGSNENGNYLKAVADNAASGLGKKLTINLNSTPFINITWKVEKDLKGINEKSKKGHDYAARLFVIKKTGATALSNRELITFFQVIIILVITGRVLTLKNQLITFYQQLIKILMNGLL